MNCDWVRILQHSATASPAAPSSTETRSNYRSAVPRIMTKLGE